MRVVETTNHVPTLNHVIVRELTEAAADLEGPEVAFMVRKDAEAEAVPLEDEVTRAFSLRDFVLGEDAPATTFAEIPNTGGTHRGRRLRSDTDTSTHGAVGRSPEPEHPDAQRPHDAGAVATAEVRTRRP